MLKQLFSSIISWVFLAFQTMKHFILDEEFGITLYSFFLAILFLKIAIFIVDFIKAYQAVYQENTSTTEKEKKGRRRSK